MCDLHEAASNLRAKLAPVLAPNQPILPPLTGHEELDKTVERIRRLVVHDPRARRLSPALRVEARRLAVEYWIDCRVPALAAGAALQVCLGRAGQ